MYPQDVHQINAGQVTVDIRQWLSPERRDLIYQNQVSDVQLHEYMFARRFCLLMLLNRPLVALREAMDFLQNII